MNDLTALVAKVDQLVAAAAKLEATFKRLEAALSPVAVRGQPWHDSAGGQRAGFDPNRGTSYSEHNESKG